MGTPLQQISLKDLIGIIQSYSGKLSHAALAEKLSDITKEYLKENDRKRFEKEREKALRRPGEGNSGNRSADMVDADWQLLSAKTIARLISGKTQGSHTAALEAHSLIELMRDMCATCFEFDFDRMAAHTLRQLKERDYDTAHWETQLREDQSYQSDDFIFDLVRFAVASGQGREVEPVEKPVKAPKRKDPPIPEDPGFDPRLLADIELRGSRRQIRYSANSAEGSPLAQLLWEWEEQRCFLLYGEGDSGVAGAGKTTAMRHLLREKGFQNAAYVPLREVYSARGMRRMEHEKGTPRVLEWLKAHGHSADGNGRMLLLMDGLDEIEAAGIQDFCDDLEDLVQGERFVLVLSSVLLPEQLPNRSALLQVGSKLDRFMKCCIQPLTAEQRRVCLGYAAVDYPQAVSTPNLINICRDVSTAAREQKDLFFRWVTQEKPTGHSASLFYRSLVAQICSWYREDPGNDAGHERDGFMLMFALPAVAFHMMVGEIYDEHYAPEVRKVDSGSVERLLRLAFPVYKRTLHRFGFYGGAGNALAMLADAMQNVGQESLLSEKTGAILCRSFDPETMEYTYRFANRAMRDGLVALHLANLFCAADENLLPVGEEFDEFYACPVRFLPQTLLESAAVLVDERMQEYGRGRWVLENRPNGAQTGLCRYILDSLGSAFSTALRLESEQGWRAEAECAYKELVSGEPRLAAQYALNHAANLCVQSRILREQGTDHAAAEKVQASIQFAEERGLLNADGYQALAMLYLTQVKDVLNLNREGKSCVEIPERDLTKAREIDAELQRLVQQTTSGEVHSEVFGDMPVESTVLISDCLCLLEKSRLRLETYRAQGFFGSEDLKFILTASFVAKAHSVWAALCPATSGAALNLLAGFFENDQECLENDRDLPFFAANPELHISLDSAQLSYSERECRAARLYLRIIYLRRGFQPYSCRNLAQALLARRFRLDEDGRPASAEQAEKEFRWEEIRLLEMTTRRACTRLRPTYAVPRIRYLNERIDVLEKQRGHEQEVSLYQEEAGALFRREWVQGKCEEKLDSNSAMPADLLAVTLAELYRENYLPHADPVSWLAKIKDYHTRRACAPKRYTLGESFR